MADDEDEIDEDTGNWFEDSGVHDAAGIWRNIW